MSPTKERPFECECGAELKRAPTSNHLCGRRHSMGLEHKVMEVAYAALAEHGWVPIDRTTIWNYARSLIWPLGERCGTITKRIDDPRLKKLEGLSDHCVPAAAIPICKAISEVIAEQDEARLKQLQNLLRASLGGKMSARARKQLDALLARATEIQLREEAGSR